MKSLPPVIVVLTVLALAVPAMASDETTVGSFVRRLAQSKNVDATEPRIAIDSLRSVGIDVPADLDLSAPLTEGEVARIARSIGLDVSTNRPDTPFTDDQIDRFFESTRVQLALGSAAQAGAVQGAVSRPRFDPYTDGKGGRKGKKKGRHTAPAEPE